MFDNPSLVARVRLSPSAFQQYSKSAFKPPTAYTDWSDWLDAQEWQGKDSGLTSASVVASVNRDVKSEFCAVESSEFAIQRYDEQAQTFTLVWFEYSVNYPALVEVLNSFRQIADFKDTPDDDFLTIGFEGWSTDEVIVVLQIRRGESSLLQPDSPAALSILEDASETVEGVMVGLAGLD